MPTYIATARDLQGRSIQRQVTASDRQDAVAQLEALGMTSVRLREVLAQGEEQRASLLRKPSRGSVTRSILQRGTGGGTKASAFEPDEVEDPRTDARRHRARSDALDAPTQKVEPHQYGEAPPRPRWVDLPDSPPDRSAPPVPETRLGAAPASAPDDAPTAARRPLPTAKPDDAPDDAPTVVRRPLPTTKPDDAPTVVRRPLPTAGPDDAPAVVTRPLPTAEPAPGRDGRPVTPFHPMETARIPPDVTKRIGREPAPTRPIRAATTRPIPGSPHRAPMNNLPAVMDERSLNRLPAVVEEPARGEAPKTSRNEARAEVGRPARKKAERPIDARACSLSPIDRITFFGAVASMVNAGLPLLRAVHSMHDQFSSPVARAVMAALSTKLSTGSPLSDAMASLPRSFTRLQIGSVRGAEKSGRLSDILTRLAGYEERTLSVTRQLRSMLTYPLAVFACAFVLILVVGRALLTGLAPALTQANVQLNMATAAAIKMARALESPLILITLLALVSGAVYQAMRWLRTPAGQSARDRFVLRLPILSSPIRMVEAGRICEAFATLYGHGLTLVQCVELMKESSENVVTREALGMVLSDLREGVRLSHALERSGFFGRTMVQMVNVGEETGRLEMAFSKVAQYHDLEVRSALEQFAAAIEPAMFVVLGVVVGVIALIAFAPLYQLMSAFS